MPYSSDRVETYKGTSPESYVWQIAEVLADIPGNAG